MTTETHPPMSIRPSAPAIDRVVDEHGEPLLGTYFAPLARVDLANTRKRVGQLVAFSMRKRWFYVAIATDDLWIGAAIVDAGYATQAFVFAASPTGKMLCDLSWLGPPKIGARVGSYPEEGTDVWFRQPGIHMALRRAKGAAAYDFVVDHVDLKVLATLDTLRAPSPITAIAKPLGGDVTVTSKRALMDVRGTAVIKGDRFSLDGALGGSDYTQGLLPRVTAWRWAFLLGRTTEGTRVGLNLVEGFNGQPECAVWLGRDVFSVGEGRFTFDRRDPLAPWHVTTTDGAVDLEFTPVGAHSEARDMVVVRSDFTQPVGTFRGTIRLPGREPVELEAAPGVVEDQSVRW